jgi:hypothetical protein
MSNKVVKSVSFNITNERDIEYLERIKSVNFSGYVKRLIEKDIRQRKVIKVDKASNTGYTTLGPILTRGTTLTLISE